ncbi:hypothetical protein OESDEN_03536 [Oesophagostomum dentatum]|uniref:Uncharacterized protein n=1 Tax=Oesophagostomum dentatum TaxID=61180 RepID=A0A0B1TL15_OESDE|nr:hypothetical protein OESDEN_03536 [Oesophagostomum dentatum]
MSQENTNLSAPSRMGNGSPENGGFIDWYDSPKILFPTQSTKLRRSVQFKKTRSAEDFSPHRSYLNDTGSTSDLDSIWCTTPLEEPTTSEEGETSASTIVDEETSSKPDQTTPHRSFPSAKLLSRKRRRKPELLEIAETNKESPEARRMSMEEDNEASIFSETVLTPTLARPTQRFITSTPKSSSAVAGTPLKRFHTMDGSPARNTDSTKDKIQRTQSLNVTGDGSDDDSFLDDVFVPFTDPSQFIEMLTHNSQLRKDN